MRLAFALVLVVHGLIHLLGFTKAFQLRLASRGEGRWHEEGGEYAYLELELDEVDYNVPAR